MNWRTSVIMAILLAVVVGGALWIGLSGGPADVCKGVHGANHTATINNGKVSNADVVAKKCDTLTIRNNDHVVREFAFGVHGKHVAYDGFSERVLSKDQSLTITLKQTGRYHWHDHLHDEVEGYFTVK